MLMARDRTDRIASGHCAEELREHVVLHRLEARALESFELDADRELVALRSPLPSRAAGMPGTLIARHELHQFAASMNEEVRGDLQPPNGRVVRMGVPIEAVREEALDR